MNTATDWQKTAVERYQALLLAHGALVLLISLVAGIILIFSMLEGFIIWPFMNIPADIPGSVRGWKAAHVGGLTNGLLLIGISIVLAKVPLSFGATRFVFWSFILTGWANTLFYWAGNLAANRGVSFHSNSYGESDLAGVIAFFSGGSVMLLTIIATFLLTKGAFRLARTHAS